jgi:uncharacterized protein (DUF362 family)
MGMKRSLSRRDFLKISGALGIGGIVASLPLRSLVCAEDIPDLIVVRGPDPQKNVTKAIEGAGGIGRFIARGDVVAIKPNMGWDRPPEMAANTNPQVVAAVVRLCFEAGAKAVTVLDNPCDDPRRTYTSSGIAQAARELGATTPYMDRRRFKKIDLKGEVLREWEVYQDIIEADKVINIPVAKHHGSAGLTLSMKNWMGAVGGSRSRMHWKMDQCLPDLAAFFRPALTILDCVRILTANGPQGGDLSYVKALNLVVLGTDQVAIDAFGAGLFEREVEKPRGVARARRYIEAAAQRGIGQMNLEKLRIKEMNLA